MSAPRSFTGGCHCGAIRYECTSRPIAMLNCHCRDCQQMSGGAFEAAGNLPMILTGRTVPDRVCFEAEPLPASLAATWFTTAASRAAK